jgi:large subunit ribosomal protein L25
MSTTLKADKRDKVGTRHARKLRDEGRIPATLQAAEDKPHLDISIDEDEFLTARRQHEHVYTLDVAGQAETALVRELAWDVFGERIIHVEFRRVDLHKQTEVEVELDFRGNPKGGLLNHLVTSVLIRAKPQDIPDSIVVNIDGLEPGVHLSASDLVVPDGVELAIEPDTAIATINEPRAAVEEAEAPAEGEEAAAGEEGAEASAEEGSAEGEKTPQEGD